MKKIVLTGAAGRLGSYLREPLSKLAETLVSTDLAPDIGELYESETYVAADLASYDDMFAIIAGADMVVHFGAIGDEAPFDQILGPNIIGVYNVWEAAHHHGVRRVVYASSIHAVGMHSRTDFIGTDAEHRPDSYYGLAKCFAEDLARMYWEKRGLEAVCMRLYSVTRPNGTRSLGAWLSYDDLIHLVDRAISTPSTGFAVVYGVSNNDRVSLDNSKASFLGYRPKDNAEVYATDLLANSPPEAVDDIATQRIGGAFAAIDLGESGVAHMNILDDSKTA
jgi:uronate dehydrogenase